MSETLPKYKKKKPRPPKKITENYLYNAGLYYLGRFPASTSHFCRVMMRKINNSCRHHEDQNIEECIALLSKVVDTFTQQGLLNDADYTRSLVTSLRRRGLSARAIQARLSTKGIPQEQTKEALNIFDSQQPEDSDFIAALILARRKKIGPFLRSDRAENQITEKQLAKLARAGFSYDIAQKIINMSTEEAQQILQKF